MSELRSIVEDVDTTKGRIFDIAVQLLIVFSLICYSLETLPTITVEQKLLLGRMELLVVIIFTIEYALRIYVAKEKSKYVLSFFGIVDILSIAPYYFFAGADTTFIRSFRLLRLVRTLKLTRYSIAAQRLHRALILAKDEIILYFVFTIFLLFLASVGIHHFEYKAQPDIFSSVFHSLWWAVTTLTTVGYGDAYPITTGGRIFTFFVLVIGLGVVAVPAGLVASALSAARLMEDDDGSE